MGHDVCTGPLRAQGGGKLPAPLPLRGNSGLRFPPLPLAPAAAPARPARRKAARGAARETKEVIIMEEKTMHAKAMAAIEAFLERKGFDILEGAGAAAATASIS